MNNLNMLNGMQIVESNLMTKGSILTPKRKAKTKRLQKKFNKKYGFISIPIPDDKIYIIYEKIVGHPITIKKLIKEIK